MELNRSLLVAKVRVSAVAAKFSSYLTENIVILSLKIYKKLLLVCSGLDFTTIGLSSCCVSNTYLCTMISRVDRGERHWSI